MLRVSIVEAGYDVNRRLLTVRVDCRLNNKIDWEVAGEAEAAQ